MMVFYPDPDIMAMAGAGLSRAVSPYSLSYASSALTMFDGVMAFASVSNFYSTGVYSMQAGFASSSFGEWGFGASYIGSRASDLLRVDGITLFGALKGARNFSMGVSLGVFSAGSPAYSYYNDPRFRGTIYFPLLSVSARYEVSGFSFLFLAENMGAGYVSFFKKEEPQQGLPPRVLVDVGKEVSSGEQGRFWIFTSFGYEEASYFLSVGALANFYDIFELRAGVTPNDVSAGFGVNIYGVSFDAAFKAHRALGVMATFGLSYRFGVFK